MNRIERQREKERVVSAHRWNFAEESRVAVLVRECYPRNMSLALSHACQISRKTHDFAEWTVTAFRFYVFH